MWGASGDAVPWGLVGSTCFGTIVPWGLVGGVSFWVRLVSMCWCCCAVGLGGLCVVRCVGLCGVVSSGVMSCGVISCYVMSCRVPLVRRLASLESF